MQLSGRRFIVTGAGRGIGKVLAEEFTAEGALVTRVDVEFPSDSPPDTDSSASLNCDISSRPEVAATFRTAVEWMGGLDGLVNAAGIMGRCPADTIDDDTWNRMLGVNLTGTFLTNQLAFPYLKHEGARIVNFGSDAALIPSPYGAHYAASKGAVISWTRSIAHEWGKHGITANCVMPAIWTPMYDEQRGRLTAAELRNHDERMAMNIPVGGRLGDPVKDLAPVLVFLASTASRFITGQLISVTGGLGMTR